LKLKTLIEKKCHLIDYEEMKNEYGKPLVRFGFLAGIMGMTEIFNILAKEFKLVFPNFDLLAPFIIGIIGNGNISKGVHSRLKDGFPYMKVPPDALKGIAKNQRFYSSSIYVVNFDRKDTENFSQYLPYLTVLINAATWKLGEPKFVTEKMIHNLYLQNKNLKLKIIGDIICDIDNGGIDIVKKTTTFKKPFYYWNPETNRITIRKKGRYYGYGHR